MNRTASGLLQGRTCIYFGEPLTGHVNPSLGVVRHLIAEGCHVRYYATPDFADRIMATGAEFVAYKADLAGLREPIPPTLLPATRLLSQYACEVMSRDFADVADAEPDFIVNDLMAPWGRLAARMLEIPSVSVFSMVVLNARTMLGILPAFAPTAPRYISNAVMHTLPLVRLYWSMKKRFGTAITPKNLFHSDFLNVVLTAPFMQPAYASLGDSYVFARPNALSASDRLHSDAKADTSAGCDGADVRTTAYVSLGTLFNTNVELLHRSALALSGLFERVVISLGGRDQGLPASLPGNVEVHKYVNQSSMLRHTELFVTHAGMSSVIEALERGVPMIMVPQVFEQDINARTLHRLGAGLRLGRFPSQERIREAAARVTEDEGFGVRAMELGRRVDSDGLGRVCALLAARLAVLESRQLTRAR